MEKVHAMLHNSGMLKFLWAEAVVHAVYLKNRTWTCTIGYTTPYEILYGHKPNIGNLHPWGCKVQVSREVNSKLESHSFVGRWMGFDEESRDGHRVYWPEKRKVSIKRSVKFNFKPDEVIIGDLPLKGVQSVDKCLSAIEPETMDQVDHLEAVESGNCPISIKNLPNRQANPDVKLEALGGRGK